LATPLFVRIWTIVAVILPPIAILGAIALTWGGWCTGTDLALLIVMYLLTGMGITIGYHRLFTHLSFETPAPVRWTIGAFGSMAAQGPVTWWVATHRRHHMHSDEEHDPHSPHAGAEPGLRGWLHAFAHAHVGWLMRGRQDAESFRLVPDLIRDPVSRHLTANFVPLVLIGLAIPTVVGAVLGFAWGRLGMDGWQAAGIGALMGLLWGGLVRIALVHHITWSINSVCHLWGSRPYESGDHSRNNPIFGVLAFGEGWHNNHHAFPASPRHGLQWWQFDSSWIVIRTMMALGLARKPRLPSPARMEAKRRRAA